MNRILHRGLGAFHRAHQAVYLQRLIRERLARGQSIARTAMLPALFFNFLRRWHRGGLADAYQDAAMDPVAAHALFDAADPLAAFLSRPGAMGTARGITGPDRRSDRQIVKWQRSWRTPVPREGRNGLQLKPQRLILAHPRNRP